MSQELGNVSSLIVEVCRLIMDSRFNLAIDGSVVQHMATASNSLDRINKTCLLYNSGFSCAIQARR